MTSHVVMEPGRVVRMRERLWRIDFVDGPVFGASALDGRDNQARRFHLSLETVDEGSLPLPIPESLGDEPTQRLLLDAQKFALLHGTAPILGLQRSRAIPTDYQMVPLLMALGADRVRMLVADDVGTGKTIEAGLVLSELIARGKARRVLIVVPANLREQWREALDHFFHLDATVVSGTLMPALERQLLPGQSVWATHNVVIASIDYLKTKTAHVLSHDWDLVVIDEAHLCAQPHAGMRGSSPDMERWRFAVAAASAAHHVVLLTATPHNGYSDSYASLFRMLDPSLVRDTEQGPIIDRKRARERHVVQRRRADIEDWYAHRKARSPFPKRDSDEQIIDLSRRPEMRQLLDVLNEYAEALYRGDDLVDKWIAAHLQKRALSSPAAVRQSITNRRRTLQRRSSADRSSAATLTAAREATGDTVFGEDDEGDAANLDVTSTNLDLLEELAWLDRVEEASKKVTPSKDPKLAELMRLIPERMAKHPDAPRVLVFTKYRDTLDYLVAQLEKAAKSTAKNKPLPDGVEIFAIHGQLNLAQRMAVFAAFERAPGAVLVATDCISEGLNLQRACAELIHYELPWNPNRLEQRNGRIDRFQQREPVVGIRTLVFDDPLDAGLLFLIDRKAREMQAEYGFVPPFLANPDILLHLTDPGAGYREQLRERGRSNQISLFDELGHAAATGMDTLDPELARMVEAGLTGSDMLDRVRGESFYGQADISLETVESALARSREEIGSSERVRDFVLAGLRSLRANLAANPDGTYSFREHPSHQIPDELSDALVPGARYSFDPTMGLDDPDIDVVDLAHRLPRRLIDLTLDRAQLPECHGRVAARISPAAAGVTAVAHVLFRYVARGNPPVLLEEVVPVAWRLSDASATDPGPLLDGPVGTGRRHRDDIIDDARRVLGDPTLPGRLASTAQDRALSLAARHTDLAAEWAAGLDDVEATSHDLVALTVVYPQVGAP